MTEGFEKILITGATGSLGKQLIYELNKRGKKPIAQVRVTSDTSYIDSLGLEKRTADLEQFDQIPPLVAGIDAVIHCAAVVNFHRNNQDRFTKLNAEVPSELYKAAQNAGVKKFIHISTVVAIAAIRRKAGYVNGKVGTPYKVSEESEYNLDSFNIPYFRTKRDAELKLLELAKNSHTELVIINPSIIVAPSRTGDDRGKTRKSFSRFVIPSFPNRVNLVDIRDVAPAIINALDKGRHGERYILAGDNVAVRELVLLASMIIGRVPHLITPPKWMLNFAASFSVTLAKLKKGSKVSFYPDIVKLFDYEWSYSSMKARRELGFKSRSIQVTLNDLLHNAFLGTHLKP